MKLKLFGNYMFFYSKNFFPSKVFYSNKKNMVRKIFYSKDYFFYKKITNYLVKEFFTIFYKQ